ncbi:MAG: EFR1 family ferrodoxin [Eubacterium sp.]|jgi:ferredoxin/flavodoxin
MIINDVYAVYFSPTGSTEKVCLTLAETIAERLGAKVHTDDFTLPAARTEKRVYKPADLVVFAVPTYAGRIPNKILPFIRELFAVEGVAPVPAIAAVTFGNRSFDSSLAELRDELKSLGFAPLAGAAAACCHAFADIGTGRPDEEDIAAITSLASEAADFLRSVEKPADISDFTVEGRDTVEPYYKPLREDGQPAMFLKAKPLTSPDLCDKCGSCARVCPMGSISAEDPSDVPGICIKCQACVVKCPKKAKYFDDADFLSHKKYLETHYKRPAKTEIFKTF